MRVPLLHFARVLAPCRCSSRHPWAPVSPLVHAYGPQLLTATARLTALPWTASKPIQSLGPGMCPPARLSCSAAAARRFVGLADGSKARPGTGWAEGPMYRGGRGTERTGPQSPRRSIGLPSVSRARSAGGPPPRPAERGCLCRVALWLAGRGLDGRGCLSTGNLTCTISLNATFFSSPQIFFPALVLPSTLPYSARFLHSVSLRLAPYAAASLPPMSDLRAGRKGVKRMKKRREEGYR
jgi:hypothetical protein